MSERTSADWRRHREYWERHANRHGRLGLESDPDALGNVCWPGQPLWLNAHLGRMQEGAYGRLLSEIPVPRAGTRALDFGCGSARWSRVLAGRGYEVTGIDLQPALIKANRQRFPDLRFECVSIQDFEAEGASFDLVSSVTVIQHNPYDEQERIAARVAELVAPGGFLLMLENIRDRHPYVFPRPVEGWIELLDRHGFEIRRALPYDYSPALKATLGLRNSLKRVLARSRGQRSGAPDASEQPEPGPAPSAGIGRHMLRPLMRAAVSIDRPVERALAGTGSTSLATHCGFLFEARG